MPAGRLSLISWLLFGAAVAAWTVFLRPEALGGPAAYITVSGTSMLPALREGDLVVTTQVADYGVGDVVAYRVPAGHPAEGARVIHRIIGFDDAGGYVLRGDNTPGPDVWHPVRTDLVGRSWFVIPGAGRAIALVRQPAVIASLAAALAVAWLLGRSAPKPAERAASSLPAAARQPTT